MALSELRVDRALARSQHPSSPSLIEWLEGLFWVLAFFCFPVRAEPLSQWVCPDVWLKSSEKIEFSETEKRMLCGDPQNPPWSVIPLAQKKITLKAQLQDRGYFDPLIDIDGQGRLQVEAGRQAYLRQIRIDYGGAPAPSDARAIEAGFDHHFRGLLLTPALLSRLEGEVRDELKSRGFPCVAVKSMAEAKNGEVQMNATTGKFSSFGEVNYTSDINPFVENFERYQAFHAREPFDYRLLQITENRIMSRGVSQYIIFLPRCEKQSYEELQEKHSLGPPRLFRIGVGVNTEEIAVLRTSFRDARMSVKGSSAEAQASVSFIQQELNGRYRWFYPWAPARRYLSIVPRLAHEKAKFYETATLSLQTTHSFFGDPENFGFHYDWEAGPAYTLQHQLTGTVRGRVRNLSLVSELDLQSHLHEFQVADPRQGWWAHWSSEGALKGALSPFSAWRNRIYAGKLWMWPREKLREIVFGIRGEAFETFSHDGTTSANLPQEYRRYLGGSDNLRGFKARSLPESGQGALSALYLGVETRFRGWTGAVEPLAFLDVGATSEHSLRLDSPYYLSPGLGLRYKSFIGTFRASYAWGFTAPQGNLWRWSSHGPQFYFSWGEEF